MKKRLLSIFSVVSIMVALAVLVTACSSKRADLGDKSVFVAADTVGLAQFQLWKAQQIQYAVNSSMNKVANTPSTARARKSVRTQNGTTKSGSMSTTTQYPAKSKPTGWSKAAKGAAIGAGGGAVIGAVVNKRNRAVGAAIGGVAGGVIGYGIGRHMDKKDGRY